MTLNLLKLLSFIQNKLSSHLPYLIPTLILSNLILLVFQSQLHFLTPDSSKENLTSNHNDHLAHSPNASLRLSISHRELLLHPLHFLQDSIHPLYLQFLDPFVPLELSFHPRPSQSLQRIFIIHLSSLQLHHLSSPSLTVLRLRARHPPHFLLHPDESLRHRTRI